MNQSGRTVEILSIAGSHAHTSANRAMLRHAERHLTATYPAVELVEADLLDIPVFDPRLADDPPDSVMVLSEAMATCDGLLLAAPEYAGGLAGGVKTALDWMVGLSSLYRCRAVVLSAGTTGGEFAIEQLVRTLSWQGAWVVDTLGVAAPRTKIGSDGVVRDAALAVAIEQWADRLVAAVDAEPVELESAVRRVVSPLGIDMARFGTFA